MGVLEDFFSGSTSLVVVDLVISTPHRALDLETTMESLIIRLAEVGLVILLLGMD